MTFTTRGTLKDRPPAFFNTLDGQAMRAKHDPDDAHAAALVACQFVLDHGLGVQEVRELLAMLEVVSDDVVRDSRRALGWKTP